MSQTLVLNATFEPLSVVSERRGLILVLNQRATSVEDSNRVLTYARGSLTIPSVIKLHRFVKIPYRHTVPLSRRAIFARDKNRCGYCGSVATTVDHIIPRSRGGGHVWENVVAACKQCNHDKDDLTLKELGWNLHYIPREPTGVAWRILGTGKADKTWIPYLESFGIAVTEVVRQVS